MDKRLDNIEFAANYLKIYFLENYEKDQKDNLVRSAVETIIKETKKIRTEAAANKPVVSFPLVLLSHETDERGEVTATFSVLRFSRETPDLSSEAPTPLSPRAEDKEDS